MAGPNEEYEDVLHTIAFRTRETDYGCIVESIPIMVRAFRTVHVEAPAESLINPETCHPVAQTDKPSVSNEVPNCDKTPLPQTMSELRQPPKKKWIREYLEEEPKCAAGGAGASGSGTCVTSPPRCPSPRPAATPPPPESVVLSPAPRLEYSHELARQTSILSNSSLSQTPSPPSTCSSNSNGSVGSLSSIGSLSSGGSSGNGGNICNIGNVSVGIVNNIGNVCNFGNGGNVGRPGTREVHNKLEKNRRAHLKECFEMLKRQLPAAPEDKKTSNLAILGSAIRCIQVLKRKEMECEYEIVRLAKEKIAFQQRITKLEREMTIRALLLSQNIDGGSKSVIMNGSISNAKQASPLKTLNLSAKLPSPPLQIKPSVSQMVSTAPQNIKQNTLTITTVPSVSSSQNPVSTQNGVTTTTATLVHPAQIHLPISQVVSNGLVVAPRGLQLLSTPAGLRALQTNRLAGEVLSATGENGVTPTTVSSVCDTNGVVVGNLTPLVVASAGTHLLHASHLTHQMVDSQVVKVAVNGQYLSAAAIVKPVVMVTGDPAPPALPRTTS